MESLCGEFRGVFLDIISCPIEMLLRADQPVPILCLPKLSRPSKRFVDLLCGESFPGVEYILNPCLPGKGEKDVHMVRHYYVAIHLVTLPVKVMERVHNDSPNDLLPQAA